MSLPRVDFFGQEVSRLICGSNPFLGYSYRSAAHSKWQRRYFTPERISEVLEKCLEVGINTLIGNMDDDRTLPRALNLVERRIGKRMNWIAYTHGGAERQEESIRMISDDGAFACYIQGGVVDSQFQYEYVGRLRLDKPNTLQRVRPWLSLIREKQMIPGLGTHRHQIIQLAEEMGIENEFFVTTLNFLNFYCSYAEAVQAIRKTSKPVIVIKTLAGSARVRPQDGLTMAFTAIKPKDIVAVGMENEESAQENAHLAEEIIAGLDISWSLETRTSHPEDAQHPKGQSPVRAIDG
ncbi:MAG: hypothetical protein AMS15_03200 [Planctomycetes bacterium DG_23]|nr:MAG: hypothetical protein AMS15_03200 [Planctomycetes bacterium DG_23]